MGGGYEKMHEQSRRVYGGDGISPTVHTAGGGGQELKIIEPIAYDEQNGYLRKDGCVGTLTTDGSSPKHNNRVVEPIILDDYNGRIRADQSTIGSQTTNCGNDAPRNGWKVIEPDIRIRKLTPKECWRLMDFDDADIDKAKASGVSDSQLYKQAGNSIVVSVLENIFKQMF